MNQNLLVEILDRCFCVVCQRPKTVDGKSVDVAYKVAERTWMPCHSGCLKENRA